jgi:UDP-N-acetylglucosamine 2-epimerase
LISLLAFLGTRPEAIKLAPLLIAMRDHPGLFHARLCVTGQHAHLVPAALRAFGLQPDFDLALMRPQQPLGALLAGVVQGVGNVLQEVSPDLVIVQGDTVSALGAAQAAFYQSIPVMHVEAGLRTHRMDAPFPEEMHRVLISRLATLHCAPTGQAAENLRAEGILDGVHVTGNTGVDALLHVRQGLDNGSIQPDQPFPAPTGKRIVVTLHRRESFAGGLAQVCDAIAGLLQDPEVEVVMPLHLNPAARSVVLRCLGERPRLTLTEPLDYGSFVALMRSARLLITDSGGIQEEAPYLGLRVLVARDCTERPEGVAAGWSKVVGFQPARILETARAMLSDPEQPGQPSPGSEISSHGTSSHGIYGDGSASHRILQIIRSFHDK